MLYTILCTLRVGVGPELKRRRLDHYDFLRRERGQIVEGGPLLGPDGAPAAMLLVVNGASPEAAREFIASEPYHAAGLFESVSIQPWRQVIPEPEPGSIEREYQKELAAHQAASAQA